MEVTDMGDRPRREDLCYYCYCPCIEPGYSFAKYYKYLLPLLILLWVLFYPLGDPGVICENNTDCSGGTFMRIVCSSYRYLGQLTIPELPKLNSILEVPALQRLSRGTTFDKPIKDSTTQSSIENSLTRPCNSPEYSPDNRLDETFDGSPQNTTDCEKCSRLWMFPGCSSNYRCRIRRSFRR
ncbi:unnamed protein product [Arctia plantaginis]|uniref:Uncharacterized protein n=1 Tax=Arctia plantaginis TaxID=874455 RepID=A0A8S0ZSY3_ARCPL|nr:unnamed protein product [Arctia plantaginis]